MKKAEFSTDKSISILLVLIFLVVIVLAIDPIKEKLFAATTDIFSDDKTYEKSGQKDKMIEQFKLFDDKIKACQESSNNDCFCNINLNFPADHELLFDSKEAKLIRNKNIVTTQAITLNRILTNNLNCKIEDVNIRFDDKRIIRNWASDLSFIYDYDVFKSNKGEVCWITSSVDKNLVKDKKVC